MTSILRNKTDCTFCGEAEGTERIADPNLDMGEDIDWNDEKNWWKVCKDCKEFIYTKKFECIEDVIREDKRKNVKWRINNDG